MSSARVALLHRAARYASNFCFPPIYSPFCKLAQQRNIMPIYTVNKRKPLVMSSRLSKQPHSARKEFFGPGAPRSSDTSATDVPPEDSEPTSADQRPARKRSVSKLLAELQPSSGWVQAGPVLPAKVRASSASRARDPADLNSDGRSQAAPTGSASAAAVFSKAVSQIKKPSKQSSRSNSEAFPVVDSVPAKVRRTMNADAPAFVPLGARIPVHLAPDCEWDDEQILAADDLRRSQAVPGQFYSTGSASTNVPSHIPHPKLRMLQQIYQIKLLTNFVIPSLLPLVHHRKSLRRKEQPQRNQPSQGNEPSKQLLLNRKPFPRKLTGAQECCGATRPLRDHNLSLAQPMSLS